ncbi:MAG TPA: condensation domain-containing protein, partial [Blastocatellia bacterium]|nr:condensation domain-containing protein [Blastocatellia bacterium]
VVVVNEVVQYFPSLEYLLKVLEGIKGVLARGGSIYLGDLRSLDLLEVFHSSVELSRASGESGVEEVRGRIRRKLRAEKELVVSPQLFEAMAAREGWISEAAIELKGGEYGNELTKYRYDVVLRTGRRRRKPEAEAKAEWEAGGWSLERLRRELSEGVEELRLSGVPNARVARDVAAQEWLTAAAASRRVSEVEAAVAASEEGGKGIEAEAVRLMGRQLGYEVSVSWPSRGKAGSYEVRLRKARAEWAEEVTEAEEGEGGGVSLSGQAARWRGFANRPLAEWANASMAGRLREYLQERLPAYMVPGAYIEMEGLPLTANGKVDRKALPEPEAEAYAKGEYEEPQGEIEQRLAAIWSEVLKVERVGRRDNFFEMGGHSLLVVRVIARLRQGLNVEVSISEVFEHPVLADLAMAVERATPTTLPAITPAARDEYLPLSFAQQRLWFLAQMGVSQAYHIFYGLRLKGELDREALRRALDGVVTRHETLRTTFVNIDGEPAQQITPALASRFHLQEHDLREGVNADREMERLIREEAATRFDLEQGPLIRGRLIRTADAEHALLITMHHIVSDGWSMDIFIKEVSVLYRAFARGEVESLPALEVQYADYAVWQRQWLQGEVLRQQTEYWQQALARAPGLLELPTDHARPAEQKYEGGRVPVALSAELSRGLKRLSQQQGTTLFMTLLAGLGALLSRLSGQHDVVIGTPVANRGRVEIEGLIGFFINTLALRLEVSGAGSVREMMQQVKERTLAAQQHQELPFEQVVEVVRPERNLSHTPVFQVLFDWQQNVGGGRLSLPGIELEPLDVEAPVFTKFDLKLTLLEIDEQIAGEMEYAASLFERETVERYVRYFCALLESMVSDSTEAIDRLSMLPEGERRQVVEEWNATAADYPKDQCVHELFEQQVEQTPEAMAVVCGEARLTYGELNRRANQLAHYLRQLGVGPDARVAICAERGVEMMMAVLAVFKAGGAYVPLDPAYPPQRLRYMLEDSAPAVLLTQARWRGLFPALDEDLPVAYFDEPAPEWRQQPSSNPAGGGVAPENLAYVIYTSGSTGQPKGVMVEQRGMINHLYAKLGDLRLTAQDVVAQTASPCFDISVWQMWAALLAGGQVLLVEERQAHDPAALWQGLREAGVTVWETVPSLLEAMLGEVGDRQAGVASLRWVLVTGEACAVGLWRRFQAAAPGVGLMNAYGPTECSDDVTHYASRGAGLGEAARGVPIGRPLINTRAYVVDAAGEAVPVGVSGEL